MRSKFKWIFTLLVALTMQLSFAQEKTVKGIVTDASGPMPGVNVVIKGTQRGVSTGFDGSYSIKASQGEVLVFSFMGMNDILRTVDASASINVKMQDNMQVLEAVVVTGVGIKKTQQSITSSQQQVKAAEITQAANPNVVRSLAGKVSGLQINNTSSGVNGATRIQLRGSRSISGNNEALVVIDNSISSASVLQLLPPETIESVNVIKGPGGSALYGELGSNGVIIVTTKKGSKGESKLAISVNSSVDFENISFLPERQQKYGQGWDGTHFFYENGAWGEPLDGVVRATGLVQADGNSLQLPYSAVKDNIKDFYQTGTTYQTGVTLNFSGSEGYALLSANRQSTDFIVDGDGLKRNSFIFKGGKKVGKWNFDGNVNYISTKTSQSDSENDLLQLLQAASNIPVGLFANSGPGQGWNAYYANPFWVRKNDRLDRGSEFFNGSANLGYKFNSHFDVSYLANIQTTGSNQQQYSNQFDDVSNPGGGDVSQQSSYYNTATNSRNYYGDLVLNFNYDLTKDLSFKLNLGNNLTDRLSRTISQGGTDLEIDGWYHIQNVLSPAQPRQLTNNEVRTRKYSFFGNMDLGFRDYLFLNGTVRKDFSSVLVSKNVTNGAIPLYYSGGLSFVPTKAFASLKDNKILNYTKLFGNYSVVGNASPINTYELSEVALLSAGFPYGSLSSYNPNLNPTDALITPERVNTLEAGISLGFFNNRLTLDGSYYKSNVRDLITRIGSSSSSALQTQKQNIGEMDNKGFEIDLGFTPIKTESFTWSGRVGYSANKTVVKFLGGGATELLLFNGGTVSNIVGGSYAVVGEEFPMIKGTTFLRDDQGRVVIGANGVPVINSNLSNLGKATPDYIVNFSNSFDWKGLRLAVSGDYRAGASFLSETKYNLTWSGHLSDSAEFDRDLGFVYPNSSVETAPGSGVYTANDGNTVPLVTSAVGYAAGTGVIDYYGAVSRVGEFNLIDGTALKIREIALSYGLPSKITDKLHLSSLRFGVNARNPFIQLAKGNKGYADPEASNLYSASNTNGSLRATALNTSNNGLGYIQTGQYPSTKTYGFSINLTF
ncbi:MAG: SusC/RagA family TonB-linked outer membrane protein [Flavobacterium sp.]|uniref:SusC/RagA family TonB-linked outer membrane protein n=1 Tax=Flavobacterium sp. TaxID=239 RepID=UPI003267A0C0